MVVIKLKERAFHARKRYQTDREKTIPQCKRLTRKQKKVLAAKALEDVLADYDFSQKPKALLHEMTGVAPVPVGIIPIGNIWDYIFGAGNGVSISDSRAKTTNATRTEQATQYHLINTPSALYKAGYGRNSLSEIEGFLNRLL